MTTSLNKVFLIGNLGQDPEIRFTQDGRAICTFSMAMSESWTDKNTNEKKEKTEWVSVVVFGKLAEICGEYLAKGRRVYVAGKLQTRSWDDANSGEKKYKTEVVVDMRGDIIFLTPKGAAENRPAAGGGGYQYKKPPAPPGGYDNREADIPF